jgi:hypothetical protein
MKPLPPAQIIAEYGAAFRACHGAEPPALKYERGWFLLLKSGVEWRYRGAQIVHMTGQLWGRVDAARDLFAEVREKARMAVQSGRQPEALLLSRDIWDRMKSAAGATAYIFPADPAKAGADTVLSLPVEIVGGHNHLSVRVRGETSKG